jgi:hypothetical protein
MIQPNLDDLVDQVGPTCLGWTCLTPYSFFVMSCIDIKPTSDIDDTHHYHASVVYLERGAHGLHGGRQLADGCANSVDLNHRVNNVPLELCPVV